MAPVASPAAYLRIYEPLAAFPSQERARWERYATSGAPARVEGTRRERAASVVATIRPSLDVPEEAAFVQWVDGLLFVCPWQTQLRVWEAAIEFRDSMPARVAEAFLPSRLTGAAETELERWRSRRPDLRAHVRVAPWTVPLPWFIAFEPGERVLVLGEGIERSLRYTTLMSKARRRVAAALAVLRRSLPDAPTIDGLTELGSWLEEFHPHARVELDYGGLVDLLDEDALRSDSSVGDLADGLAALAEGRGPEAVSAYEQVVGRWRRLSQLETAS